MMGSFTDGCGEVAAVAAAAAVVTLKGPHWS